MPSYGADKHGYEGGFSGSVGAEEAVVGRRRREGLRWLTPVPVVFLWLLRDIVPVSLAEVPGPPRPRPTAHTGTAHGSTADARDLVELCGALVVELHANGDKVRREVQLSCELVLEV